MPSSAQFRPGNHEKHLFNEMRKIEKEQLMSTVRLAPVLRPSVGGSKHVSAEGKNLAEVLNDVFERFPALKEQIQPYGTLSRFINIYVNDQDVRYLQGLETNVGPTDTVILLPAMAGGHSSTGKNYAL
jgi:molybdopterin converting factor small subunit